MRQLTIPHCGMLPSEDALYFIGLALFLVARFSEETSIFAVGGATANHISSSLIFCAYLFFLLHELQNLKVTRLISCVLLLVLMSPAIVRLLKFGDLAFIHFGLVVFFSRNVPFKSIMIVTMRVLTLCLIICIIMFLFGVFPDLSTSRLLYDGTLSLRSSLGFVWPSRAPNYVLAITLCYILGCRRDASPQILALLLVGVLCIYVATGSRNPTFLSAALIICSLVLLFKKKWSTGVNPLIPVILALGCCLACLAAAWFYDPNVQWMETLNEFTSGRLRHSSLAIHQQGLSVFGFEGFTENAQDVQGYYDSSYLVLFGTYGIALGILLMTLLCCLLHRVAKENDSFVLLCILICVLHGIMEGQLLLLVHSPFWFLLPILFRKAPDLESAVSSVNPERSLAFQGVFYSEAISNRLRVDSKRAKRSAANPRFIRLF